MEREETEEKTSQNTLLHGGDVGGSGMSSGVGGSWGYVRQTKNVFTSEVAKEFLKDFVHLLVVK